MAAEIYVTILTGFGLGQLLHFGRELNAMDQLRLNTTSYFGPLQLPLYSSTILWIRQPRRCRKVSLSLGALTRMEVDYSTILVGDAISRIEVG
jgi:hypothetical protein